MNKNYDQHYFKLIESISYLELFIDKKKKKILNDFIGDTEHSYYYISVYTKLIDKYKSELISLNYNEDMIDFDVQMYKELKI